MIYSSYIQYTLGNYDLDENYVEGDGSQEATGKSRSHPVHGSETTDDGSERPHAPHEIALPTMQHIMEYYF